jgi:hypothetical protein
MHARTHNSQSNDRVQSNEDRKQVWNTCTCGILTKKKTDQYVIILFYDFTHFCIKVLRLRMVFNDIPLILILSIYKLLIENQ